MTCHRLERTHSETAIPYFAELLPKVGAVTILLGLATPALTCGLENLSLSDDASVKETGYRAFASATELNIYSEDEGAETSNNEGRTTTEDLPLIAVPLPAPVDDTATDLIPFEDGYELKCRIAQPSSSQQSFPKPAVPETFTPLPASELQGLRDVQCANCKQTILRHGEDDRIFERVLDLPSEHWLELVDCWMCHQEDYPQFRRGAIAVKPSLALIGHTYVMIHAANIDPKRISLQKEESGDNMLSFRKWHTVRCQKCHASLGEGMVNETDSEAVVSEAIEDLAFKIYKHTVEFEVIDAKTAQIHYVQPHPISTFVAADMIETTKAHATYRFAVYDRNSSRTKPYFLAWLFQWDSKICTNFEWNQDTDAFLGRSAQHLLQGIGKTMNVMKILYVNCLENDPAADRIAKLWLQDKPHTNQLEHLTYETEECLEILSALQLSTACLPPSRRKGLGGFQFGFLRRN